MKEYKVIIICNNNAVYDKLKTVLPVTLNAQLQDIYGIPNNPLSYFVGYLKNSSPMELAKDFVSAGIDIKSLHIYGYQQDADSMFEYTCDQMLPIASVSLGSIKFADGLCNASIKTIILDDMSFL